jgi:flagellar motor switch protein FliG
MTLAPTSDAIFAVALAEDLEDPPAVATTVRTTSAAFRALSNRQKVAVVIAQMGPKRAVPILNELSDQDAIALATAVAELPELDDNTVIEVLGEFARKVATEPPAGDTALVGQGGLALAREFLVDRVGLTRADEIMAEIEKRRAVASQAGLTSSDPREVAAVLVEHPPQAIAVVLAHMRPEDASRVLGALPDDVRTDIVRRIALLGWVDPAAVRLATELIEEQLLERTRPGAPGPGKKTDDSAPGAGTIAQILSYSGRSAERQILAELAADGGDLARQIRDQMFTFDDVVALEDVAIQQIVRRVPPSVLAPALKDDTLSPEVVARVRANLTERAISNLDEELEVIGTLTVEEMESAQAEVVQAARDLEAEGLISFAAPARADASATVDGSEPGAGDDSAADEEDAAP